MTSKTACRHNLADVVDGVFPAMQQNVLCNDDQHYCFFNKAGRWGEQTNTKIPLALLETPVHDARKKTSIIGWEEASGVIAGKTPIRVKKSHPIRSLVGRIGKVQNAGNTKGQQMQQLDDDLKKVAELWTRLFTDERWTPCLHIVTAHTMRLMQHHKFLGKFSNSVIESFHKKVRWFYAHTNREGKGGEESSREIMLHFWGLKTLDCEAKSQCNKGMIAKLRSTTRPICACDGDSTTPCCWR